MEWAMNYFSQPKFFQAKKVRGKVYKTIFTRIWYGVWLREDYAKPEDKIVEKYRKLDPWSVDYILFFRRFPSRDYQIYYNTQRG